MSKYFLLCGGEYFCNDPKQYHGWDISVNYKYRHLGLCPDCMCDKDCVLRGDCCPDLFFSLPELVCVNRTIINGNYDKNRTEQYSALMVSSCPKNSDRDQRERCTSLTDTKSRLGNFPVTGSGDNFPLTFYNKYCAECNNVTNYTSWTLDIDCNLFADFNFLSSLDDIIETAISRKCVFQAFHEIQGREIKEENCFDISENSILKTKCNETGEWRNFDPDIQRACESSLKTKFKVFKNVFCYMCNPSGQNFMEDIYETCNETGQWHVFDRNLKRACDELSQSEATFPFKNIFCYLCNRGMAAKKPFVDVYSFPQEISLKDTNYPYLYKVDIFAFDLEYFKYKLQKRISEEQNLYFEKFEISSFRNKLGEKINLTNLLLQGLALDGKMDVCKSRHMLLPFNASKSCECDPGCFFAYRKCRNITCYSGKYLNGEVCLPLLQITQNLRFSLKVRLGVYYKDSHSKIAFWPKPFERIKSDLEFHLAIDGILKYDIVATTEKFENPEKEIDFVCWIVKFEIFIYSSAPRLHVEESLLEFKTRLLDGCNMEDPNEQLMFRRLSRDFTNPYENALSTPYHIRIKYFQARISNILLCRQIELTEEEYNTSDGNPEVLLLRSGIYLPYDEFDRVPDGSVRVCLEDLQKRQYFIDGYHDGTLANLQLKNLWIMSLICSVISLISLLLSLIIYLSFPVLHTTPGKLLIIMMVSLFITLCFLQLSYFVANSNAGCLAVAVILHFSWLSVFTSMLTTNFHMFRTFSTTEPHRHSSGRFFDKTVLRYEIFIVGLPILFIAVNASLSWFINSDNNLGYGGRKCFINDRYLLISTFIFPIGLICILNIFFFFITIHAIHKTPNPESTHQRRSEMTIYLRLTSITGISWTLQIIDSFLPVSVFTFFSTFLNSLQGFFVFLAFIANKRTIKLIRDKISKQKENITTSDRLTEVNSKDIKQSSCV
ncbi:hypothetical protein FSP39_014141 [Pinctada imbricata]|uniref:G-protein coupled receptors family 2 profile 2 domain-containing protein n=1 Tax=Pinctada imbricata TaxID=66713 RepID=A0AA88YD44_PINIB|nr:hypothetical protein FSP39_014141 [Pinctada imbricata]